jgi:predicted ATPase
VGIGISQVVPVIVSAVSGETGLQMIEQPELHLHPRLQAELGDLFVSTFLPDDVSIYNQYFDSLDDSTKLGCPDNLQYYLIETHSEHLILRFLRRIREATDGELPTSVRLLSPDDVTVTYLEGGNTPTIATVIRIDKDGEFLDRWPRGFFEERAKELF